MTPTLRQSPGHEPDALDALLLSLRDRRVVVVGLGKSGISAIRLLLALGAQHVLALDDKAEAQLGEAAATLRALGNVQLVGGGIRPELAAGADLLVLSPGVPRRGAWWEAVAAAKTPWLGEAELAWRTTNAPWLTITGTNGKSTTTTLLGLLLQQAHDDTFVGGNLGTAVCGAALAERAWKFLVVEMSSYQCEGISSLDSQVAILTNLTPDHLERYVVPSAYYDAKMRLFQAQSPGHVAVVNAADGECMARAAGLRCQRLDFNVAAGANQGVQIESRTLLLRRPAGTETYLCSNPAIRGQHNLENAAAAVAAARAAGISRALVQAGLDAFQAVPHRLQEIGQLDGVAYFNDSKGTNVDATVKALLSFPEPLHLIAGGLDKGASYQPMVDAARGRVKACYVIGQAAGLIAKAMEGVCPVVEAGTMENALDRARAAARPGEVVLLSPACASFDQFKNYEHRGDVFAAWVHARMKGNA